MDITEKLLERDLVVIGLAQATHPQRAAAEIPAHWQRFLSQQLSARIPVSAADPSLYCVY